MDVTQDLADYAAKHTSAILERGVPVEVDAGLLAAFDNTPIDVEAYSSNLDNHLLSLTLTSTQALLANLFSLPTTSSAIGPMASLPLPTTLLPREKPLPKPKVATKWERFAKEKGISHVKKDKYVWDDEKQDWVPRWGRGGKNKEVEEQWIHEVKAGANADLDPAVTAKLARKNRTAKNLRQQAGNISDAASKSLPISALNIPAKSTATSSQVEKKSGREIRKSELQRTMLISKTSTASLGKFDEKIEGEPKARGVKRKFEGVVGDLKGEKQKALDLLPSLGKEGVKKKPLKKGGEGEEGGLNVRKAVRFHDRAERGRGGARG
ncbi:regulator of ribosome biosynthesis, partial [Tremellales sp. Uapishka_1]